MENVSDIAKAFTLGKESATPTAELIELRAELAGARALAEVLTRQLKEEQAKADEYRALWLGEK